MNKEKKYKNLILWSEFEKEHFTKEEIENSEREVEKMIKKMQIRENRKSKKLTQEALAKKANLPRSTIARIESGKSNPTVLNLKKIAKAMKMKLVLKLEPK